MGRSGSIRRTAGGWSRTGLALLVLCGCGEPEPIPAPRALLLVTVDTLRADRLGAYGSERGLSPRIDALARKSLVFDAAYAPSPYTFPSIAGLLTGRYPNELGIRSNRSAIPADAPTLAGVLREAGWRTGAVVSNFVLRNKTGLARHFDFYDDTMLQAETVRAWPERIGRDTTNAAIRVQEKLEGSGKPWFLWVHYQDPHGPYTPPAGFRERYLDAERAAKDGGRRLHGHPDRFGKGVIPEYQILDDQREVAWYRAGYDGEIAYLDAELGRLLDTLGGQGRLTDAAVVFAADHGEALGEHDYWFAHGHQLTDELVRVPLLLRVPGRPPGRRSDVVSLVDVVPTLSRLLLGIAPPADGPGRDLFAPDASVENSVPYMATFGGGPEPQIGLVEDGYKLILSWRDGIWSAQLYRSGNEELDLSTPAPQVVRRLRARLVSLRQRYDRGVEERRQEFSEEEKAMLRALGYLGPSPE
jgi:arylsulfatase